MTRTLLPLVLLAALAAVPPDVWQVSLRGIGPVRYGMTVAEATRATGQPLSAVDSGNDNQWACGYVEPGATRGVSFMTAEGRVVRADVSNPTIRTLSGIGVGSSEADVRQAYGGRIVSAPHVYGDNGDVDLIFVPRDRADRDYRVVFEVIDGYVVTYRSGLYPAVTYVEGCL